MAEDDDNPMTNPKIIRTIIIHLSTKNLKELRLICTFWNTEICKILQQREIIEFHHVADISKYLATFTRKNLPPPEIFQYPFARFHFCKIRLNLIHDNYLLRTFFKKYVGTITHLQMDFTGPQFRLKYLRMCVLENITSVQSIYFIFKDFYDIWPASLTDDGAIPNALKSVKDLTIYGFGRETTLKSLMVKILPYFPDVSRIEAGEQIGRLILDLAYGPLVSESDPDSQDDGLKKIPLFPNLTDLDLNYINPAQIDTIIRNNLRLKSLRGELHMCTETQIQALLECISPTLEELGLQCHNGPFNFPTPILEMTAMVTLDLTKVKLDLSILEKFPMLKNLKLKMVQIICPDAQRVVKKLKKNDNLVTLTLELCDLNVENLTGLARLFPSLRKLDLPFFAFEEKSNLIEVIFLEMKELEELHVSVGGRDDSNTLSEIIGEGAGARVVKPDEDNASLNGVRSISWVNRDSKDLLGNIVVSD